MSDELKISDAALQHWLERSGALDAARMKNMLAQTLMRAWRAARQMSQSDFLILADGLIYVVRDDVVVAVLNDDGRHARLHRDGPKREQS